MSLPDDYPGVIWLCLRCGWRGEDMRQHDHEGGTHFVIRNVDRRGRIRGDVKRRDSWRYPF